MSIKNYIHGICLTVTDRHREKDGCAKSTSPIKDQRKREREREEERGREDGMSCVTDRSLLWTFGPFPTTFSFGLL